MTAEQQKAKELMIIFCSPGDVFKPNPASRRSAIKCVDEEIQTLQKLKDKLQSMNLLDSTFEVMALIDEKQTVKQEIINYK